jgi:aminoglycoside phosphotransferase family enzyme/predicted kinase
MEQLASPEGPIESARVIKALMSTPALFGPDVKSVELVETHISWVLLAGPFAWKIKKPVNFDFLDFSTLEKRQRYCRDELRLNRRYAPEIYLEVVPITGTVDHPKLGGEETAIDYAIKMRCFDQSRLLSHQLKDQRLQPSHIDQLAREIAEIHARIDSAPVDSEFGTPVSVLQPVMESFKALRSSPCDESDDRRAALANLQDWCLSEFTARTSTFEARRRLGFVRECHGDLHLGNMFLRDDGSVTLFDGIEFSEKLRWIDVASEIAFVTMDLEERGRPDFAHRFLNSYLEWTGDYALLAVLRFYAVYRAVVRAKVTSLRLNQSDLELSERERSLQDVRSYLTLAERFSRPPEPMLLLTFGLSGSGKSTVSATAVEYFGAVRVRSDIERKRLFGVGPHESSGSSLSGEMYAPDATRRTYDRLQELSATILDARYTAIVDATFLHRHERDAFRRLAVQRGLSCFVLSCEAPVEALRDRIRKRAETGGDPSEATLAVLEYQRQSVEPLTEQELPHVIRVDTAAGGGATSWLQQLQARKNSPP